MWEDTQLLPELQPFFLFSFPTAISQILALRIAKATHCYFPWSHDRHAKSMDSFANRHHAGKIVEVFTVSERIVFLSTQKNDSLFQSNYMPSFKLKLFSGYPSKQENTHPQNVLTAEIYVQGLNNSGDV